jgi:TolA-binding protein
VRTKVLGSHPDAAEAVETFIANHPHSHFIEDILYDLGRMYEGKGRYEEALSTFERLLSGPGDSRPRQSALYRRSVIQAERKGAHVRAAEGFEEYLRTYPEGIWAEESMRRLVRIREILEDREAVQRLRIRYLRRFADAPAAHEIAYQCAHGYRQSGDYDKALEYYDLVIASYPRSRYREAAMYWAGWCLGEKGVDPERNRYFTMYLREFPRGEWRQTIAEAR